MNKYAALFKDPRWQRKRLEIMERDEFCCNVCMDESTPLNVHHSYYVKGRNPWEYPDFSMETLCEDCHKAIHDGEEIRPPSASPIVELEMLIQAHEEATGSPDKSFLFHLFMKMKEVKESGKNLYVLEHNLLWLCDWFLRNGMDASTMAKDAGV